MSACCVSGCKNRHSSTSKLKFYRIPSGYRPFQANRRRLWLQAIQQVNGSAEELRGNVRICGAHFISGEASMDHDSPDFVPSVFTCPSPKKKAKRFYGRRKRRRRKANVKEEDEEEEEETIPPRVESPMDVQSPVLMEETQTSPYLPEEGETLTKRAEETETKTITSQITSSPNTATPSFKVPAGTPNLGKMIPTILLKPVFATAGGYQCELCDQTFNKASQLVKHKQLHEKESCGKVFESQADLTEHQHVEEPSFLCNMCDRSFTTSHNLKRHKLLHVKDGRKCHKCGVLFCRLHNHVLFLPQSEQESSITESLLETPEPNSSSDLDDDAQSSITVTHLHPTTAQTATPAPPNPGPLTKTRNLLPPASHRRIISEIPVPMLIKPYTVPRYQPLVSRCSRSKVPCRYPATLAQPCLNKHLQLPPSLQIFSPQYLTSAFLDVKRNYEYILNKSGDVKTDIVKEELCEQPLITPHEQTFVEPDKKERVAYDLEVVL